MLSIVILEQNGKAGGLASSERDHRGFLWDIDIRDIKEHEEYGKPLPTASPESGLNSTVKS